MLATALAEPYPQAYDPSKRLVPWGKYGRLGSIQTGAIVAIHDENIENPREPNSIPLPLSALNQRDAIYLGLSPAEVLAQMLHLALPGGPDGYEGTLLATPAISSVIASVKTLVNSTSSAPDAPRMISAEGPVASFAAQILRQYRPGLQIESSHTWSSWHQLLASGIPALSQPSARYLAFPT
jgi:hypothetical protein